MAWRDRLRRRAAARTAAPGPAARTSASGAADPSVPGASVPGAQGTSLPGDWDGGWRRTSPPALTVARAPLGVSDGLTFRAGLASWQDPSFDTGLGHAVLPSAPVGLVRGVTGPPVTGGTYADGGPLLLRALRTDAGEGEGGESGAAHGRTAPAAEENRRDAKGSGKGNDTADRRRTSVPSRAAGPDRTRQTPASDTASVQRSVTSAPLVPTTAPTTRVQRTEGPGAGSETGAGSDTDAGPGARVVRPDEPGRPAPAPEIPVVRRIAVVPDASGVSAAPGAPAVRRTAPEAGRPTPRERAANSPVRPTAPGPSLTVARRAATPVRRITALRPTVRATEVSPSHADAAPTPLTGEAPRTTPAGPTPTVQRAAAPARPGSRPPLGESMPELPSTVRPLAPDAADTTRPAEDAHPADGPTLPIVQRQLDASAPGPTPTVQRAAAPAPPGSRPPLGESMPELPPTARPSAPDTPTVQRAAAPARPGSRPPLGAPLTELPSTARPLTDDATGTTRPADGPALPIVQRQVDTPVPAPGSRGSGPAAPRAEGRPPSPAAAPAPPRPSDARPSATGASGVRARGGLGAPLPSMPATADVPGSAGSGRRPHSSVGPVTPHVQRTPAHADRSVSGPHTGTAPLLGTTETASIDTNSLVSKGNPTSPANPAPTTATPLVAPGGPRPTPSAAAEPGTGPARPTPASEIRTASASSTEASPRTRPGGTPPVVIARAVTSSAPLTAHTFTASHRTAQRSLSLLATRPLTVNTRVPDGIAPPAAARAAERPVVTASWRREPSRTQTPAQAPARAQAPAPATQLQRSAGSTPGATASYNPLSRGAGSAHPHRAVPVVRPNSPVQRATPLRSQPLPVTDPQAAPVRDRPAGPDPRPAPPVPVVQRAVANASTGTPAGAGLVPPGVPVTAVPAGTVQRSPSAGTAAGRATGTHPVRSAEAAQDPGIDLDELARRLLEPMARLLRADLRRGRERAGRPYDGRR
ncbi:hypothetical protein ACFC8N_12975 [Streptomyces sp. NPDC055966]|uniref:hypothetical protein n=1 Tax=Streptomyces sp. NPDC055966 TaxID=3345669 RepID=UPI0035DF600E